MHQVLVNIYIHARPKIVMNYGMQTTGTIWCFGKTSNKQRAIARCTFAIGSVYVSASLTVQLWKANRNQFPYIGSHAEYKREYGVNITFRRMHVCWSGRQKEVDGGGGEDSRNILHSLWSISIRLFSIFSRVLCGAHMRNQFLFLSCYLHQAPDRFRPNNIALSTKISFA